MSKGSWIQYYEENKAYNRKKKKKVRKIGYFAQWSWVGKDLLLSFLRLLCRVKLLFLNNLILFVGWETVVSSHLFPLRFCQVYTLLITWSCSQSRRHHFKDLSRRSFLLIFYELTDSLLVICWLFVLHFYMERTQASSTRMCGFTEKLPATMCSCGERTVECVENNQPIALNGCYMTRLRLQTPTRWEHNFKFYSILYEQKVWQACIIDYQNMSVLY